MSDGRPAGASRLCEGGLQCCCVCPMCVREDNTRGSTQRAPRERWQDTFEAHERRLSGRLSAGCCSRGLEDETELRSDRYLSGKLDHPSRERERTMAPTKQLALTLVQNQFRTVTKSIIYFRTLDMSLRFLGR